MIISMVASNIIIDSLGNSYLFIFFGTISFLGLIYSYFFIKDTTYGDIDKKMDAGGERSRLNDKQKKQLYWP
jgi:hypothetical protein